MATQEERFAALEQTTKEHRSLLQTFTYELISVKERIRDVKDDMSASFKQVDERFKQVDARFSQVDERFNQVEVRLDKIEATMATKEDLATLKEDLKSDMMAMENRILNAFHQLITMIHTK